MKHAKTKVVHSISKDAWNVVGTELGGKHKIARCPYVVDEEFDSISANNKQEAKEHAEFISECFNSAYNNSKNGK